MVLMLILSLLYCMTDKSLAFPLFHLMQLYNTIERVPQQSQVIPPFVMTPAQVLQNQIAHFMQPYQIFSNHLTFRNHLMQPGIPQTQVPPTYPFFGNLLPMTVGGPNTQMLPVVSLGQQGLLSGSDSEERILSGVLMVPVDPGLQGNILTVHQAGVSISGHDSGILMGHPSLDPVGQQRINITIQSNETVLVASEFPGIIHHEWGTDNAESSIMNPTHSTPIGLRRTPNAYPTEPSDTVRGDMVQSSNPVTENWEICDPDILGHQDFTVITRGDGHVPIMAPEYLFLENNIR